MALLNDDRIMAGSATNCPLCSSANTIEYATAYARTYLRCPTCTLIFLSPAQRLSADEERAHYATHQNDPADARYRAFLDRLAIPLIERIAPGTEGLDVGSGPGPTLSLMLQERGFPTTNYDPFFAPNPDALTRSYDFITATEAIEHFYHPGKEFARFDDLLRPGGIVAVMTEMVIEGKPFAKWHYPRDPTHVCFYGEQAMDWIAHRFGWTVEYPRRNVTLLRKASQ